MKRVFSFFLLMCLLMTFLFSCSGKSYKNDVEVDTLKEKVEELLPVEYGYTEVDQDYFDIYFGFSDKISDFSVVLSSASVDLNEFGIFHVKDKEDISAVKAKIQSYMDDQKSVNIPSVQTYAPSEVPKLEKGSIKVFGNYIVYLFLFPDDQTVVYKAIENLLK